MSGLDIERMGELVASFKGWVERGGKRVEKWRGVVESLVKDKGVSTQVSFCCKSFPPPF